MICPECGERVSSGARQGVEQAHETFLLSLRLRHHNPAVSVQGERLARTVHEYSHGRSWTRPNWAAVEAWMPVAREWLAGG